MLVKLSHIRFYFKMGSASGGKINVHVLHNTEGNPEARRLFCLMHQILSSDWVPPIAREA